MTPLDVEAARALIAAATPGPWATGCWHDDNAVGSVVPGIGMIAPCGDGEQAHADAAFIAAARDGWPAALDALEEAVAVLERIACSWYVPTGKSAPAMAREFLARLGGTS